MSLDSQHPKPALTSLPIELLIDIASRVPRADQSRLLRVSKLLHAAAVQVLYADIPDNVPLYPKVGPKVCFHLPLHIPSYAQHVHCLSSTHPCCDRLPYDLPNLQVLKISRPTTAESLIWSKSGLRPHTVVISSVTHPMDRPAPEFLAWLEDKRVVIMIALSWFEKVLPVILPTNVKTMTLVLGCHNMNRVMKAEWFCLQLFRWTRYLVATKISLRFPQLQEIRMVLYEVLIPAQTRLRLQQSLQRYMEQVGPELRESGTTPIVQLQSLSEFSRDESNMFIVDERLIEWHYDVTEGSATIEKEVFPQGLPITSPITSEEMASRMELL